MFTKFSINYCFSCLLWFVYHPSTMRKILCSRHIKETLQSGCGINSVSFYPSMATPVHTVYSATPKCVSLHSILLEGVASSIIIVWIFSYLINPATSYWGNFLSRGERGKSSSRYSKIYQDIGRALSSNFSLGGDVDVFIELLGHSRKDLPIKIWNNFLPSGWRGEKHLFPIYSKCVRTSKRGRGANELQSPQWGGMDVFWNDIIQPWIYFMYPSY